MSEGAKERQRVSSVSVATATEQRMRTYLFKDMELVDYMMSFQTGVKNNEEPRIDREFMQELGLRRIRRGRYESNFIWALYVLKQEHKYGKNVTIDRERYRDVEKQLFRRWDDYCDYNICYYGYSPINDERAYEAYIAKQFRVRVVIYSGLYKTRPDDITDAPSDVKGKLPHNLFKETLVGYETEWPIVYLYQEYDEEGRFVYLVVEDHDKLAELYDLERAVEPDYYQYIRDMWEMGKYIDKDDLERCGLTDD